MDAGTCSESCQDSDIDGSEFPGRKGGVVTLDHVVEFLLWLRGMWVGRHENAKVLSACWMCSVGHLLHAESNAVGVPLE